MMDFHSCRVCGARWASSPFANVIMGGVPTDYGLCATCNEAARIAVDNQTPAMRDEQRRRRLAHFGNDGTRPVKQHRDMLEADFSFPAPDPTNHRRM